MELLYSILLQHPFILLQHPFILFAAQQLQKETTSMPLVFLGIVALVITAGAAYWIRCSNNPTSLINKIMTYMKAVLSNDTTDSSKSEDDKALEDAIKAAGYAYDAAQDIFYSRIDAWQRGMGYCRLYDELSATFGMIIDCEPIYFEYDGKKWMIEFWKGQYDLTTGCEIGIYSTDSPDTEEVNSYIGTFFQCASDEELLQMYCSLSKNQSVLFTRKDKHWWLTGFKVGEYSEPSELVLEVMLIFKNKVMCEAFTQGLYAAGYSEKEIYISGNRVGFTYDKPKTPQPITRTRATDEITQHKNEFLCNTYLSISEPYSTFPEKMNAIRSQAPWLYHRLLNLGKGDQYLQIYEKIKKEWKR